MSLVMTTGSCWLSDKGVLTEGYNTSITCSEENNNSLKSD